MIKRSQIVPEVKEHDVVNLEVKAGIVMQSAQFVSKALQCTADYDIVGLAKLQTAANVWRHVYGEITDISARLTVAWQRGDKVAIEQGIKELEVLMKESFTS